MEKVQLDAITERIIGAAHRVSNTLGAGFVEKVYENAHAHEMRKDGLVVVQQHPVKVIYDGIVVVCKTMNRLSENILFISVHPR
jgi:GxxExxY protein